MRILISGGCKQGKSTHAQHLAKAMAAPGGKLYYVATMVPTDAEDRDRIRRHVAEREGWGFETVEQPRNLLACLDHVDRDGAFLLDSTTALLAAEMFGPGGSFDAVAGERVQADVCAFAQSVRSIVVVSDGIYSDAALYDDWTETYRRGLASIDRALAEICDCVLEVTAGQAVIWKGEEAYALAQGSARVCDGDGHVHRHSDAQPPLG